MNYVKDERVITLRRKINSYAFSLVYFMLLISILIKSIFLRLEIMSYISEFIIFFVSSLFVVVNSVTNGVFISHSVRKKPIVYSIINIVVIVVVMSTFNLIKYGFSLENLFKNTVPIAVISFIIMFITFKILDTLSSKAIENKLK